MIRRLFSRLLPIALFATVALSLSIGSVAAGRRGGGVYVHGYMRKDGTYVQPHMRSVPDGNFNNNWSTQGNVNPYTGQPGSKTTPPHSYGQDVYVRGYTRSDGAYVPAHYRSAPDGDASNNWSEEGNINPYTGQAGHVSTVRWLQSSLVRAGEDPGPIDGELGRKTARAFHSFAVKEGTADATVETTLLRLRAYVDDLEASEQGVREAARQAAAPPQPLSLPTLNHAIFRIGSTSVDVLTAQGSPDRVKDSVWFYGRSSVAFEYGHVARWTVVDRPLNADGLQGH
ncbi:MAG TPA: hypothetical protein VL332_01955 [Candidatus Saccharimonadaceae bacterium]|jgi:hypothetical protein|nr:hypothetical protein [Candidatus Saccharimonadaceae bacterium]